MPHEESYYDRNKEARKAYQRAYYAERKEHFRRKRELEGVAFPEKASRLQDYQHSYYLKNRVRLLEAKRAKRAARRANA